MEIKGYFGDWIICIFLYSSNAGSGPDICLQVIFTIKNQPLHYAGSNPFLSAVCFLYQPAQRLGDLDHLAAIHNLKVVLGGMGDVLAVDML